MRRGFTLVEIMVAIMIFSIVCVVALAALVRIIDANKKAQTIKDAVMSISFTMESLTREVRAGTKLYCKALGAGEELNISTITAQTNTGCSELYGNGAGSNGVAFAFLTSRLGAGNACNLINAYEIVPGTQGFIMKKAIQAECNEFLAPSAQTSLYYPIIDEEIVTLTNYHLRMYDDGYPLLFLKLEGIAGTKDTSRTTFTLQTATSPRVP